MSSSPEDLAPSRSREELLARVRKRGRALRRRRVFFEAGAVALAAMLLVGALPRLVPDRSARTPVVAAGPSTSAAVSTSPRASAAGAAVPGGVAPSTAPTTSEPGPPPAEGAPAPPTSHPEVRGAAPSAGAPSAEASPEAADAAAPVAPAALAPGSPSRRLALASVRDGNWEVYAADENLTRNPGADLDPAWSPDGLRIAFASDRDALPGMFGIHVMQADGTSVTRLSSGAMPDRDPSWSPDGTLIAFTRYDPLGAPSIYAMRPDATEPRLVVADGSSPAWSPDGSRIAFVRSGQIYVARSDGTGAVPLTRGTEPAWSADGRLAFAREGDIHVADGSLETPLTATSDETESSPAWSPDGRRVAFASVARGEEPNRSAIHEVDTGDNTRLELTARQGDTHPAYSPVGGSDA